MPQQNKHAVKKRKRILLHMHSVLSKLCKDLEIDLLTKRVVLRRLHHEGPAFCTKILPQFSKYVLTCIENNALLDARKHGLTHFELKAGAPLFMRGYIEKAIAGNPASLYQIRQLCEYFYKTAFEMTKAQEADAKLVYLGTEIEIGPDKNAPDWDFVDKCRKTFIRKFPELTTIDLAYVFKHNRPRYGPGAYLGSERIGFTKLKHYEVAKKTPLMRIYPHTLEGHAGFFKAYPSSPARAKKSLFRRRCELRFVPKDSRGPRTISKEEPGAIQGQMAVNDFLTHYLEHKSAGRILFSDQSCHRELARKASIDRSQATLDLKEATDRLRFTVVSAITQNSPLYRECSRKLRAATYISDGLPEGKLIKYANMGSGLCFPTLGMVAYIAAITSLSEYRENPSEEDDLSVYVYGDDIICRSRDYYRVTRGLERIGLKVNQNKSFVRGYFRESCGGDYLKGVSVAPIRLKLANEGLPTITDCRNGVIPVSEDLGILALERHCRELVDGGLKNLSSYYYDQLSRRIGKLPYVGRTSPGLGIYDPLQIMKDVDIKAYVPLPVKVRNDSVCPYKGIGASLVSLNGLGEDWCLTPLRRQVRLARRVVCSAVNNGYGLNQ